MNIQKSIGLKIAIPIIITAIVFLMAIIIVNNYLFIEYGKKDIKDKVQLKIKQIEHNLLRVERKALWISSICAEMTLVKSAYQQYYETGSLQESSISIEQEFSNINNSIFNVTGEEAKIHFHLPPARSFIRSWSVKRGDDISSFRNTVLNVSENKSSVKGIEVGRAGFVIRGIVPILDSTKKYLGSVETLYPISLIVESAKISKNEEFAIFMHTDLLNIATKFLEDKASNVKQNKEVIGDLILVQTTSPNFFMNNISKKELNSGLKATILFQKDNFQYAVFPIYSYDDEAQGVGVIQIDQTDILSSINKAKTINLILGILFIVLLVFFVLYFTKILITKPIAEVSNALNKISNKKIDFQIENNRIDEIGDLNKSINEINTNFIEIETSINETSTAVLSASNQLSSASKEVSESANEQVLTTEQVSGAMEKMLLAIDSNTKNAELTEKTSKTSAKEMIESNELFIKTISYISEISQKTDIISELALQTNLLSLNAAVEAARAVELGKAFSVVALEVKDLAKKSRASSDQIEEISKSGKVLSKKAGEKLKNSIPEIIKNAERVNEIAVASRDQQKSAEMINNSIHQLTQITNKNSASAEEMSVSAEELHLQADQLKTLISVFETGDL